MLKLLSSKVILGGLALTVFTKAAMSLPILPLFNDPETPQDAMIVQAADTEPKEKEEEPEEIPPLVAGLPEIIGQCEAPEDVLRSLVRERDLVYQQQQDLEERKAEIALARERLDIEKASLTELYSSIEDMLARVEAAQTEDLDRLIDFYSNMKPADAARIMDDLDIETTIMIFGTMNPRTAAPILAKISPVRARAVSKIIFERSQLPGDQDLVGIKLK